MTPRAPRLAGMGAPQNHARAIEIAAKSFIAAMALISTFLVVTQ